MSEIAIALSQLLAQLREEGGPFAQGEPTTLSSRTFDGDPLLITAVYRGVLDDVRTLLLAGADVHERGDLANSALHAAVSVNRPDIVALLLEAGSDPHCKNELGRTPLELSMSAGREQVLSLLMDRVADK